MHNSDLFLFAVYLTYFLCSIVFSLLINGLFLKFANTLGIRNGNDSVIRWSPESKPALGGISFYIIFLLSVTAYSFFFEKSQYFLNREFIGILFTVTIGFLMGLFDDAYNTKPLLKLFSQISCGLVLIATGTSIQLFASDWLNYTITLLWVVGIMNSINMLDNMDAITSIVSLCIISTVIAVISLIHNITNPHLFFLIGVLAAVFGFLYYNWHPAKIFMGDTGSQFLGAFLAAIGIIYLWNGSDFYGTQMPSKQILSVALVFLIPLVDTTTVVIKRLSRGKSPFIGGKDHTTHHLSYLGFSDKSVALLYFGIALISSGLMILVQYISHWNYLYISLFTFYVLLVFSILFYISSKNRRS
jgi:UDP-GlcNAc:undecaprenyl-phosphate/decaprenyl-phosphate GlcNAc-1-phosphate transferase